jgi:hypothetical protein
MTLHLHEHCKIRLAQTLASALSRFRVEHGQYIARSDALAALEAAEKVLPTSGELHDQLGQYIDYDKPLTEFILDTLSDELSRLPFTDVKNQQLTEIAGYADSDAVAQRLLERLTELPNKYTLSFQLPSELSHILCGQSKLVLSPRSRIVRAGEDLSVLYPPTKADGLGPGALSGLLGALGGGLPSVHWVKDGPYLQVDADGYIGPYGGSNPHLEAIRTLRAFCGLGLALGLFEMDSTYQPQTPPTVVLLHREEPSGAFVPVRAINLDDGISRTVKRLRQSTFLGSFDSDAKRSAFTIATFGLVRVVLSGGKKADLIFLAAQWFFDGHSQGSDPLLKFIQTMVVLEILLGDKASSDQTGLNVLLRNRCAYLIGNSQEDRTELLEWFSKIYDVRSQIVHSGKHSLSASEFELFVRLRWICRRVIRKEIDLLQADEKNR